MVTSPPRGRPPPSPRAPPSPRSPPPRGATSARLRVLPADSWCFDALGLEPGADTAEVRRAYLQRAKETHPDKGGSAEDFRRVVDASKILTEAGGFSAPDCDLSGRTQSKFSLDEVSKLAAQIRQMNVDKQRQQKQAASQRRVERDEQMRKAREACERRRERELAEQERRASRVVRRVELPAGIERCADPSAVGPSASTAPDAFRARFDVAGISILGPPRRTVSGAQADHRQIVQAARRHGDVGVLRAFEMFEQKKVRSGARASSPEPPSRSVTRRATT